MMIMMTDIYYISVVYYTQNKEKNYKIKEEFNFEVSTCR